MTVFDAMPLLTRVTMTLETDEGVVATIVCESEQTFGPPHGHPRLKIGREETDPYGLPWAFDHVLDGNPAVEVVAGRITIKAKAPEAAAP